METARKALQAMKKGTVKTLWDLVVIRIGDRYIVGENPSIREAGVDLETAAKILARIN